MARAPVVCSSVDPSVNSGFTEAPAWIQAKFCGKLPTYSTPFISFLKIFYDFFFYFSLTWDSESHEKKCGTLKF